MSTLSTFVFKQRMRWYGRKIDRRHELRRRLAFYVAKYGFEVGDYSIGEPVVRLYNASRLRIGSYCSIAAGATFIIGGNHPTQTVTTSPLERRHGQGPAKYPETRGDIVVGSDVWIGANAIILSGVSIGDGAVIGAGSVVVEDIPPYAVVFGNPARIVRKRFSDEIIAALLDIRWWNFRRDQIEQLRPLLFGRDPLKLVDECRKITGLASLQENKASGACSQRLMKANTVELVQKSSQATSHEILALIKKTCPAVDRATIDKSFDELEVDSLAMLTLRAELEGALGLELSGNAWSTVTTPADVIRAFESVSVPTADSGVFHERRMHHVNMPQMAANGLSESWLFKEIGDLHWSMIGKGLGIYSSQIKDAAGDRLYPTFIRVKIESVAPLTAYAENETIKIEGKISRYGSAIFLSDVSLHGESNLIRAQAVSSFAKFGEASTNTALIRGQLHIPSNCRIPPLIDSPQLLREHRSRRNIDLTEPVFECEYSIVPYHDINGVGLLYFAAYPIINDICALRYAGPSYVGLGTVRRDVFFFANCDANETLIYRIHRWEATEQGIEAEETLRRKSDGALMSYTLTHKAAAAS